MNVEMVSDTEYIILQIDEQLKMEILQLIENCIECSRVNWLEVVSIVVSIIAVYYAVKIPEKIARNQNKIALYQERMITYCRFKELISLLYILTQILENYNYKEILGVMEYSIQIGVFEGECRVTTQLLRLKESVEALFENTSRQKECVAMIHKLNKIFIEAISRKEKYGNEDDLEHWDLLDEHKVYLDELFERIDEYSKYAIEMKEVINLKKNI